MRSMSIKEGFEVCFEDLFQRCDAASLGELVGEFRSGGPGLGFDMDLGVISVTAEADVMLSDDVSSRLIENKTGQSTDPRGTPHVTAVSSDRQQPIRRTSVALIRAVSVECAGQKPDWKTL